MRIVSSENLNLASEYRFVAGREINESLDPQQNGQRLQISRHERSEVSLSASAWPLIAVPSASKTYSGWHKACRNGPPTRRRRSERPKRWISRPTRRICSSCACC
ncbi:hypothetical protein [Pseudomonas lopnurensis]|uniref:hypothetical protein n=1 Tax=Pseudomonas lopnurensis TaxID=1477517 RepID=UPI001F22C5F0|nr:hypothetical protein [Pseudomonas lopnurensis]